MRNLILLILSTLFLLHFSQVLLAQNSSTIMTVDEMKEDFLILKNNLESAHTGLYTYTSKEKFDDIFSDSFSKLQKPMQAVDFFRTLVPLIHAIRNNHTSIHPPKSYIEKINTTTPRFPLRLYQRKDTLFVLEDMSGLNLIPPGSILSKINGTNAISIYKKMTSMRSTDGFNETFPNWSIAYAFSRYYAYYFECPAQFKLEIITKNGQFKEFNVDAPSLNQLKKMGKRVNNSIKTSNYSFEMSKDVAILKIKTFHPDIAKKEGENYIATLKNAFQQIKSSKITNLILDLRGNGGGYPEATYKLLQYLISEAINPIKIEYTKSKEIQKPNHYIKEHFYKHFHKQRLFWNDSVYQVKRVSDITIKPHKNSFNGKLYVLTNAACASATGDLIGQLYSHCNTIFIGEEAGGNPVTQTANDLLKLVLPNSTIRITLPVIKTEMNVTFKNTGHSIIPDYEIIPTITEVLNNKDVVKEFAIQLAKKQSTN